MLIVDEISGYSENESICAQG
jgi:hypothetical protein